MAAESGGGEGLADLITDQYFPSLFSNGGDTVLHDAARRGDYNAIDGALNGGEFSGSKNFKEALCREGNALGNTALHEAVMRGHVEGVKLLFSADKVVARYPNEECKSPLYLAMENRNKEIVDILFPSASSFLYEHTWRPHPQPTDEVAAHYPNKKCKSPLYLAMENKNKEIVAPSALSFVFEHILWKQLGFPRQESRHEIRQWDQPWISQPIKEILAPEFYKAIKEQKMFNFAWTLEPNGHHEELRILDIINEVSPTGDTLLHAPASLGSQEMVEFIAVHFRRLITLKNIKGDTALHVAVRSQNLHMIIILTCYGEHSQNKFYPNDKETLCRMRNEYGNTALHEAVLINDVEEASLLLSVDKVVAHYLNMEYESPLYLAVKSRNEELVDILLHAPFLNVGSHLGNSPLHAAILKKSSGGLILKKLLDKRPDLIQQRDRKGGTPLHCAASIGYVEGVRTLVEARPLTTLERNAKGYLPIHIASKKGHVKVVKEIVEQEWPDPLALLTLKGQNILHIAAKNGEHQVVSYILREKKLEKLLNERDKNGNTPLHLASKYLFPKVLLLLTQDKRVEVNLLNNQSMSGLDIVASKRRESHRSNMGRTLLSTAILHSAGILASPKAFRLFRNTIQGLNELWLKDRINILMLVAILVATVTFAAGFTMPGGFVSSDDPDVKKRGMAILVNRRMFQVFAICDTIAMYSSTIAAVILLWSQLVDFRMALYFSVLLVAIALLTMTIAFMAGLHMVVVSLSWLARAVIIIGTISLSFFLFGFILLLFPFEFRTPILRHISRILYRILIPLSGNYGKLIKKKEETKELEQQLQVETRQVRIDMPET